MKVSELELPGVLLIEPDVHGDERGFFVETWHRDRYLDLGFPAGSFVQDNQSRSSGGVLRGLHYQRRFPQGKLIRVARGRVFDVAVDIRVGSPDFGRWVGRELSDETHHQMWVPQGFSHGFCVLSDVVDLVYACTEFYRPDDDHGLIWNDPQIRIDWPIESPQLSEKDQRLPTLADAENDGQLPLYSS